MQMILEISSLTISNANIQFSGKEITWKTYTPEDVLLTTCWIELIDKKKFAKAALDENIEAFVGYVASLTLKMMIYPARKA